jgi:hypothetical protein
MGPPHDRSTELDQPIATMLGRWRTDWRYPPRMTTGAFDFCPKIYIQPQLQRAVSSHFTPRCCHPERSENFAESTFRAVEGPMQFVRISSAGHPPVALRTLDDGRHIFRCPASQTKRHPRRPMVLLG